METFLNLAHRSHRKAEFYTTNQQFVQAIYHHKVASEYLEKGIAQTHCDNIRASLISQRNHNLTQIELLTRRLALQLNTTLKPSTDGRSAESPSDPSHHQALISAQLQHHLPQFHHHLSHPSHPQIFQQPFHYQAQQINLPIAKMSAEQLEQKYRELYQIMNEQDELIQSLVDSSHSKHPKSSPKKSSPKDDKEIGEQLQAINEKVRRWIGTLVERLEKSNDECKTLREDNERLRKEVATLKSLSEASTAPPIPELPSLQPPTLFY